MHNVKVLTALNKPPSGRPAAQAMGMTLLDNRFTPQATLEAGLVHARTGTELGCLTAA